MMANKYYYLAIAPILIPFFGLIIYIEKELFIENILMFTLANIMLLWMIFFFYKSYKYDALCDSNDANHVGDEK